MRPKMPRPAAHAGANRAAGYSEELFGGASNSEHSKPQGHRQLIARVRVFVTRYGRIGYHIAECPICGDEHIHGTDPFFDPRERQGFAKFQTNLSCAESLGWRAPHCSQSARYPIINDDWNEYELVLAAEPARYAPGAKRSPLARQAMCDLRALGFPTSNETISSMWPASRWRWVR
jgi:hypothetical protein